MNAMFAALTYVLKSLSYTKTPMYAVLIYLSQEGVEFMKKDLMFVDHGIVDGG